MLGEEARATIEKLVRLADRRWRGHIDGWAQDFAQQVPVLLAEIDRLHALVAQAFSDGQEDGRGDMEHLERKWRADERALCGRELRVATAGMAALADAWDVPH